MNAITSIGFAYPWLLLGLCLLPLLWWLLRATPPAAVKRFFPGVGLLLDLKDKEKTPQRTPWWLLALRCIIAALVLIAFAEPLLNPNAALRGKGSILLIMDGGWSSAPDWKARQTAAFNILDKAERSKRPIVYLNIAQQTLNAELQPMLATEVRGIIEASTPASWAPDRAAAATLIKALSSPDEITTYWIGDGLQHNEYATFETILATLGSVTYISDQISVSAITGMAIEDGNLAVNTIQNPQDTLKEVILSAIAPNKTGGNRKLTQAKISFEAGMTNASAEIELPLELRNKLSKIEISGANHAGATFLIDDRWRRKRVGLTSGETNLNGQPLLSGLHYLENALHDYAEVQEGSIIELIDAGVDMIILADIGRFTDATRKGLTEWIKSGGTLIRFSGPKLASQTLYTQPGAMIRPVDPLMPVRLRRGGRDLGGALSWGTPQTLRPFEESSPFYGLTIVEEITVKRQVLAEPEPDLPAKTWARLTDGTPLVTHSGLDQGKVILFHITANADWSSLPISGVFVNMLGRLTQQASALSGVGANAGLSDKNWSLVSMINGFGALVDAPKDIRPLKGNALLNDRPNAAMPPGLYKSGDAVAAINLMNSKSALQNLIPNENWHISELAQKPETILKPWLLAMALLLFLLDAMAMLWLTGRLKRIKPVAAFVLAGLIAMQTTQSRAEDDTALRATLESVFGYVTTGDSQLDRISKAGLTGLSNALNARTSVEPAPPIAVNLETDELSFYPILYWPMSNQLTELSDQAAQKLNDYMRRGGLIVFDTRDAHLVADPYSSSNGPGQQILRNVTLKLDMPSLSPVSEDHVLTRSFYLLQEFPGRWTGSRIWLETPIVSDELTGELPSGFSNDGVSPVIIGGNDWAAAWAQDNQGRSMLPMSDNRQREMAYRFGVNLIMYAYTGNYKSDQVHIPALLERLGQ